MPNKVINIKAINDLIGTGLTVNTTLGETYCPSFEQLTGGTIVPTIDENNKIYINGYSVGDTSTSYSSNQLVCEIDLYAIYRTLNSISLSASETSIGGSATQVTLSPTGTFDSKLVHFPSTTASTPLTEAISVTYSANQDYVTFNGNIANFTDNTGSTERTCTITASYIYKGITKTANVNITQANDWILTSTTYSIASSVDTLNFSSEGETKTNAYTITLTTVKNYKKQTSTETSSVTTTSDVTNSTVISFGSTAYTSPSKGTIKAEKNDTVNPSNSTATLTYTAPDTTTHTDTIALTQSAGWVKGADTYELIALPTSYNFKADGESTTYTATYNTISHYTRTEIPTTTSAVTSNTSDVTSTAAAVTGNSEFTIPTKGTITAKYNSTVNEFNDTLTLTYNTSYNDTIALTQSAGWILTATTYPITVSPNTMTLKSTGDTQDYVITEYTVNHYNRTGSSDTSAVTASSTDITSTVTVQSDNATFDVSVKGKVTVTANTITTDITGTVSITGGHDNNVVTIPITQKGKSTWVLTSTTYDSITVNNSTLEFDADGQTLYYVASGTTTYNYKKDDTGELSSVTETTIETNNATITITGNGFSSPTKGTIIAAANSSNAKNTGTAEISWNGKTINITLNQGYWTQTNEYSLAASFSSYEFIADGGSQAYTINGITDTTNTKHSSNGTTITSTTNTTTGDVTSDAAITVTGTGFSGIKGSITASVNNGSSGRIGNVELTWNSKTANISLTQGYKTTSYTYELAVSPSSMAFDADGESYSYTANGTTNTTILTKNYDNTIKSTDTATSTSDVTTNAAITVTGTGFSGTNGNITAAANTAYNNARNGSATITWNSKSQTISLTQRTWEISTTTYSLSASPSTMSFVNTADYNNVTVNYNTTINYVKKNSSGTITATTSTTTSTNVTTSASFSSTNTQFYKSGTTIRSYCNSAVSQQTGTGTFTYNEYTTTISLTQNAGENYSYSFVTATGSVGACDTNPSINSVTINRSDNCTSTDIDATSWTASTVTSNKYNTSSRSVNVSITAVADGNTVYGSINLTQPAGATSSTQTISSTTAKTYLDGTLTDSGTYEACYEGGLQNPSYTEHYKIVTATTTATVTNYCDGTSATGSSSTNYVTGTTIYDEVGTITGYTWS